MCEAFGSTYQQEWNALFCSKYYLESLRSSGMKGKLRNTHFRSICWKVLLECLPEDHLSWIDATKMQRKHYDEILDKFHINPRKLEKSMDISVNNPLSQSQQSPWNQYFQDSELKVTIQQDVVRTFPEVEFFHSQEIQDVMINILFLYAREYPCISYKQGMHELLAPIIFVLHYDQQAYLEVSKTDNLDLDVRILLNQNYIEHDAFFLFCNLMKAVEAWYTMSESPKCMNITSSEPFSEVATSPVNSLGFKLNNIYKNLLKRHDVELFLYLEQMEITPQIYGIRWLRLLFGREFPFHDLLIIWDAIFADGVSFDLVDYIFVAMLITIRELLLKSDYASCLRHLMHYPNITDVQYIIDLALHLRDPSIAKPDVCIIQVCDSLHSQSMKENRPSFVKSGFPKSVFSSQLRSVQGGKTTDTRPKSLKIANVSPPAKSNSIENTGTECLESLEVFPDVDTKGNYNTFPRVSIRNVMEGKNMKFRALDVSQSFGNVEDKGTVAKSPQCREMVPLVPANPISPTENSLRKTKKTNLKDKNEEMKSLINEISNMKTMTDYCAKQITLHISKLQDCMVGQRLLYEDEMFIALAGLKRARDILKGTVAFTEEVISDDHISSYASCSKRDFSGHTLSDKDNNDAYSKTVVHNIKEYSSEQVNESSPKSKKDCDKKPNSPLYGNHIEDCSNSREVCTDLENVKHS